MSVSVKALLPLGLFLGLSAMLAIGLTKDPSKLPSMMVDRPFPQFALPDLYSPEILDNSYLEGQVTMVNIFGSWCVACVQEHPTLMRLARDNEVIILGVDWNDTQVEGRAWLSRSGNPYRRTIFDEDSLLVQALGVTGAPESFIVDKNGQIRYKFVGVITETVWRETLRPVVQSLEAEIAE